MYKVTEGQTNPKSYFILKKTNDKYENTSNKYKMLSNN